MVVSSQYSSAAAPSVSAPATMLLRIASQRIRARRFARSSAMRASCASRSSCVIGGCGLRLTTALHEHLQGGACSAASHHDGKGTLCSKGSGASSALQGLCASSPCVCLQVRADVEVDLELRVRIVEAVRDVDAH